MDCCAESAMHFNALLNRAELFYAKAMLLLY